MSELSTDFWRKCSSCKKPIGYSTQYFVCSVSTCNRKRIGYVFCSVHCWERHLPGARHRDAAAIESKSPTYEQWKTELESDPTLAASNTGTSNTGSSTVASEARAPQRVIARPANFPGASVTTSVGTQNASPRTNDPLESEILVVVSKLKNYVRERSEMNTSESVSQVLSNRLRRLCDRAIEKARAEGRKTLMDRDFEGL